MILTKFGTIRTPDYFSQIQTDCLIPALSVYYFHDLHLAIRVLTGYLDLLIQDDNTNGDHGSSTLSSIAFMLSQLRPMCTEYQQRIRHMKCLLERNMDKSVHLESHVIWLQNELAVMSQRVHFFENTIIYYESFLEHYAKSSKNADFEAISSFLSGILLHPP